MSIPLDSNVLGQLFTEARTFTAWQDRPVSDAQLERLYALTKMGPTAANGCPARFVFIRTPEGKERLKPFLAEGNVEKTMSAPVTVIAAYDPNFYEYLPALYPHTDARSWFVDQPELCAETAFRNGTLQAAYLILAARSLGLDCGPMSGFDPAGVNEAFFSTNTWRANLLINLGYGDTEKLHPRLARLSFEQACLLA